MTKLELIHRIQDRARPAAKLTQVEVKAVLDALDQEVIEIIRNEDNYVFGWGVVRGIRKSARTGINPKTGDPIIWPEKIMGKCTFGKAIADINNG